MRLEQIAQQKPGRSHSLWEYYCQTYLFMSIVCCNVQWSEKNCILNIDISSLLQQDISSLDKKESSVKTLIWGICLSKFILQPSCAMLVQKSPSWSSFLSSPFSETSDDLFLSRKWRPNPLVWVSNAFSIWQYSF